MSTKIVVVKLKEVAKTSILAVVGIIVLCFIIYLFMPDVSSSKPELNNQGNVLNVFNAGTYSSEIILNSNPVLVEVTVSESEIMNISMTSLAEVQEVFYPLFGRSIDDISAKIIEHQSTDILYTSDSPFTDQIILDAVDSALASAKIK